jgi:hypothetical protein
MLLSDDWSNVLRTWVAGRMTDEWLTIFSIFTVKTSSPFFRQSVRIRRVTSCEFAAKSPCALATYE